MAPKGGKSKNKKKNSAEQAEAVSPTGDTQEDDEQEPSEDGSPTVLRARLRELMQEKEQSESELAILKETVKLTKDKGVADDLIRKAAWLRQWDSVRTRTRATLEEVKEELDGLDQCATEALLDKLNRDWQDSEVSYNALLPYADEQEFHAKLSRERNNLSDRCVRAKTTIKRQLETMLRQAEKDKLDAEDQRYLNRLMGSGVKPVSPEVFEGERTKWRGWKLSFDQMVDLNPRMDEAEKLRQLKQSVAGPPKDLIQRIQFAPGAYKRAIDLLMAQYDATDPIRQAHISALQNLPKNNNTPAELKKLLNEVRQHVAGLEGLGVEALTYTELAATAFHKALPQQLTHNWYVMAGRGRNPTLKELIKHLEVELSAVDNEHMTRNPGARAGPATHILLANTNVRDTQGGHWSRRGGRGGRTGSTTRTPRSCFFCKKDDHASYRCVQGTLDDRRRAITKESRCYKCLGVGHGARDCTTKNKCIYCDTLRHNSSICPENFKPSTPPTTAPASTVPAITNIVTSHKTSRNDVEVSGEPILLPTFTAWVRGAGRKETRALGLLDTGSVRTFIRKAFADALGISPVSREVLELYTFGAQTALIMECPVYELQLVGTHEAATERIMIRAVAQESLSVATEYYSNELTDKLKRNNLPVSDDRAYGKPDFQHFDLLIGCEQYWKVVQWNRAIKEHDELAAIKTVFGWACAGSVKQNKKRTAMIPVNTLTMAEPSPSVWDIQIAMQEFWKLEHMGVLADEDLQPLFVKQYQDSIQRSITGRYIAPLPWKAGVKEKLRDNRAVAVRRLEGLMRQLNRDHTRRDLYHQQMQEYVREGFVKEADPAYKGTKFYLPHRDIVRPDATTTRVRPVFDGSSYSKGSPSINDALEVGPNLNPELLSVLMRFRLYEVAWTADITKAFLQIELANCDSQVLRFLWYEDPLDPATLTEYVWTRLPFGLTCSPFILRAVLLKHLELYEDIFPDTVRQLREQLYVDDWLGGADSVDTAVTRILEAITMMSEAKMELAKWITCSPELEQRLAGKVTFIQQLSAVGRTSISHEIAKALGVFWNPQSDQFVFQPQKLIEQAVSMGATPTKRQVSSLSLTLFDPMGLVSPVILVAKIIIQRIWAAKIDWDDPIPIDLVPDWRVFLSDLAKLEDVALPRWVGTRENQAVHLHVFCDASEAAYSAAIYVRTGKNPATTHLLCSKTRVAPPPRKTISIPRLELLSNLIAARLTKYVTAAFEPREVTLTTWTDSNIALYWIKGESGRWKPFIHNRVSEIRRMIPVESIRHCPGVCNPADVASRGTSITQLLNQQEWWKGPIWLTESEQGWPQPKSAEPAEITLAEVEAAPQKVVVMAVNVTDFLGHVLRAGTYIKLYTRFAWLYRFAEHSQGIKEIRTDPLFTFYNRLRRPVRVQLLSAHEIRQGKYSCVRLAQMGAWPREFEALQKGLDLPNGSELELFRPQWDPCNRVLRGAGRTERQYYDSLMPLLLPARHILTQLIIRHYHLSNQHAGLHQTMVELRRYFIIMKARQVIKNELGRCIICQRNNARRFQAPPATLPSDRTAVMQPFQVCGVDYAGPFVVYLSRHSNVTRPPATSTAHACLFTCVTTRAVHIEAVPNATAASFLCALRRFIAIRGAPQQMKSDNSQTFEPAAKALKAISMVQQVGEFLSARNIAWEFIPAHAPWWGGFWERLIGSMKRHYLATLNSAARRNPDFEMFGTILAETAAIMNSRPITQLDWSSGQVLTPMNLLTGQRAYCREFDLQTDCVPETDLSAIGHMEVLTRDVQRHAIMAEWWKLFREEYLAEVRRFHYKGDTKTKFPMIGQVVMLYDDIQPRTAWVTGRVTKTIRAIDGCIREVELINNKREVLRRPVQQLYPLEIEAGIIDNRRKKVGKLRAKKKAISVPKALRGKPVERKEKDPHAVDQQDAPSTKRGVPHDTPRSPTLAEREALDAAFAAKRRARWWERMTRKLAANPVEDEDEADEDPAEE